MNYYGVKIGKNPGIYNSWEEASKEVIGYSGAVYKKFKNYDEALAFVNDEEDLTEELIEIENINNNEAIAYVDGSFNKENNKYGFGIVYLNHFKKEKISGIGDEIEFLEMQSVGGELKGAIMAIQMALYDGVERLFLHYDYKGIENWAKGLWKTNKRGTKHYKNFIDNIDNLEIVFKKVDAHTGVYYNEEADKLAKSLFK